MCDGALLYLGWLNTYLPMGMNFWFAFLVCMAFTFSIKLPQLMSFLIFTLWFFSLIQLRKMSRQLHGAELLTRVKP